MSTAIQHSYIIWRRYQTGGEWFEEARTSDETEAVLRMRELEQAYPFDEFSIADDYE